MKKNLDLENIFIKLNGRSINTNCDFLKTHINESSNIDVSLNIKILFYLFQNKEFKQKFKNRKN